MGRKPLGDKPLTNAERQARFQRALRQASGGQDVIRALRSALSQISDRTSERLRTKRDLESAIDEIGEIAATALTVKEADDEN